MESCAPESSARRQGQGKSTNIEDGALRRQARGLERAGLDKRATDVNEL